MEYHQLVLRQQYHRKALMALHDHMGHQGIDRTLDLLRERVYRPSMTKDTQNWVAYCRPCQIAWAIIICPNQKSVIWRHTILWT